jgi:hypothetical protein
MDIWGSNPGRSKKIFSQRPDRIWGPHNPPIQRVLGALSLGINRLGREADDLPPCSAEMRNGGVMFPQSGMSS